MKEGHHCRVLGQQGRGPYPTLGTAAGYGNWARGRERRIPSALQRRCVNGSLRPGGSGEFCQASAPEPFENQNTSLSVLNPLPFHVVKVLRVNKSPNLQPRPWQPCNTTAVGVKSQVDSMITTPEALLPKCDVRVTPAHKSTIGGSRQWPRGTSDWPSDPAGFAQGRGVRIGLLGLSNQDCCFWTPMRKDAANGGGTRGTGAFCDLERGLPCCWHSLFWERVL